MIVLWLSPALRRAVYLAHNFSWCRVAHDIWKSDQCRAFNRRSEEIDSNGIKKPRPKTVPEPKITLVSPENSTTVTVLEVAQRLAKRRNLTLIKINDLESKTQRPLYKLVDNAGLLEETEDIDKDIDKDIDTKDKIAQKLRKNNKLFYVSAKITDHDLQTKTKNVMRLLSKGHKVKIVITLDDADGSKVQRIIEDAVRNDGSIQRMPSKKNIILLLINPLHKNEDNKDETNMINNDKCT